MNKFLFIFLKIFITIGVLAQVPEKISYQAVVRNSKNELVAGKQIGLRISIIQGAVDGSLIYQEVFQPNLLTNANGLVTAEVGNGTPTLGAFSFINWAEGPYFIKAEIDTTGGTNYTITGTSLLLSVPYALHAKTAESFSGAINETDPVFTAWDKDYNDLTNRPDLNGFATKDMANQNITNLADPVNAQDAATKAYVDALLKRIEDLETAQLLEEGFFDERDSNYYKIVKIGDQVWMAENLKYLPSITSGYSYSETEPCYYVNNYYGTDINHAIISARYNTYGVLYNWPAAMNGALPDISNTVQGVCPAGWHLPSPSEWDQLVNYLGGDSIAGGKLKEAGTKHWKKPNTGATNESGFTALPGGDFGIVLGFELKDIHEYGMWWSISMENSIPGLHVFYLSWDHQRSILWSLEEAKDWPVKSLGHSVRCIKN